ncbi:gluconate 2-dehydrogenase subunit 3 family protein (plasmid) [Phyllobacterium sp. A18/5-2]|uniref:gluconate 2-dehydrogenase subunit 3 family protein n=1 Tax=Phyllobacterium sp. A18/5-2 TaxID=2978392 RepID=UPI0021C9FF99|nr:gluconate 2-dehydrogenase subunit 3 family protein [Phyllobacterium sp. A18/5-2]UXN66105.1 gluconate 2-dehydrogenase subunit 3 family protein [Phyllobacterium sp. A18/5-2]
MSKELEIENKVARREFLKMVGVAGAASTVPLVVGNTSADEMPVTADNSAHHHAHTSSSGHATGYEFFNTEESSFIESAVDTLIPKDSIGPGAKELDVATYIDRQMASGYGKGDRLYLEGPFGTGTPQQGYQLRMTPSELIRAGIADVNVHVRDKYKKSFDALSVKERVAVLTDLDTSKVDLLTVPTATFFALLLQLTIEGYFSDPMYGGNKGKAAWKMIGFPGADAMYMDKIEPFRGKPYSAEPMAIQELG